MNPAGALRAAIASRNPRDHLFPKPEGTDLGKFPYAVWRFLKAWSDAETFGPDQLVLLRQIARWKPGDVFVGAGASSVGFASSGIVRVDTLGFLHADPFIPSWLSHDRIDPVLGVDAPPSQRQCELGSATEPFIRRLGFNHWKSPAQKEAVWHSLMTPPGGTSLVVLPTGMGKSLCFQAIAALSSGLTVVIVPTVALAIDQWTNAQRLFDAAGLTHIRPRFYASDDSFLDPNKTAQDIREGACHLVFTSPEACVSGKLRHVLEEAAAQHRFSNLVIDEAHIVETWGAYFRIEFQLLSGLRDKWLEKSEGSLRTLLFSATVTPRCRDMLRTLYCRESPWSEFVYQQLRPEITYFDRWFENDDQEGAVIECLWHLPRPLILYTTERDDAKAWYVSLKQQGFQRVGCFHGETGPSERRELLRQWQADELDVMVATSAFGVGVDKQDVRSVIHACLPEDLNRYYQEVGRGGRDGNSSLSLLLPKKDDLRVARTITPKLMRPYRLQQRWESLWESRDENFVGDGLGKIHLQSKRRGLLGTRTYSENVRWNKRLLMQLRRAGKLELKDLEYRNAAPGDDPEEWATVELKFNPNSSNVGTLIEQCRIAELKESQIGLNLLVELMRGERCVGRVIKELYGRDTRITCCGCRWCRMQERRPRSIPVPEWDGPTGDAVVHLVLGGPILQQQGRGAFMRLIRKCVDEKGILRFAGGENAAATFHSNASSLYPFKLVPLRFDNLDAEPPLLMRPDERSVVFHCGAVHARGVEMSCGSAITHVFSKGISMADVRFRLPARVNPTRVFDSPEQWLASKV